LAPTSQKGSRWRHSSDLFRSKWLGEPFEIRPEAVAQVYRTLRKGREDRKDEPGAADFYYGEMEMRRHARTTPFGERAILWLYWLVSGYGLRSWRALCGLIALLAISSTLFAYGGGFDRTVPPNPQLSVSVDSKGKPPNYTVSATATPTTAKPPDTSFLGAAVYSARTSVGLLRDPQPRLTPLGDIVQVVLRILAPVFLALTALAIRGRIKR
jgi:hypothetical protein